IGWLGECDLTADDLTARPEPRRPASKADQCADAIRGLLIDGPMEAGALANRLKEQGFTDNAIDAGKRAARLRSERNGFGSGATYTLSLPAQDDDHAPGKSRSMEFCRRKPHKRPCSGIC